MSISLISQLFDAVSSWRCRKECFDYTADSEPVSINEFASTSSAGEVVCLFWSVKK